MTTTNELKKGTMIRLDSGFEAELIDNKKGNVRDAKVYGAMVETGSVYSHNIIQYKDGDNWKPVTHTPKQLECKKMNELIFGS